MKRFLVSIVAATMLLGLGACSSQSAEKSAAPQQAQSAAKVESGVKKEVPTLTLSWGNEMHTGIMYLPFIAPELFVDQAVRINPTSDSQGELLVNGERVAILNRVVTKGGSECATLMGQNHLDIALTSSTAMMTAYDVGTQVQILSPVQCDGVAIAAAIDAPYQNFEEFVTYAKAADQPVKAGYHSAISSPRVVLEAAMKDAGLTVTEDPADFDADVLMVDLKGVQNLVPALSSKQVELWAGPAPHPQNAESTGVGKIISTLNELPDGKWERFPCCCFAARKEIVEQYPEVLEALGTVIHNTAEYANENQQNTGKLLAEIVGVEEDILPKSLIVYSTVPDDTFVNGMGIYYDAMKGMGKFTGRMKDHSFEEAKQDLFQFSIIEKVNQA